MPQPKFQLYKHIKINGEWLQKLAVRRCPKIGIAYDFPFLYWEDVALASMSLVDLLNLDRLNIRRDPCFCAETDFADADAANTP